MAAPLASADSVTTSQDTAVAIDVLANDSDPDGDPLSVGTFTQPASGSVTLNADDTFSYTPDAGFVGEDSFTYRAFDGDLESDPVTVTVTVEAVNAAPVAGADSVTTSQDTAVAIDVLANDSDPDGDPLSVGTFTQPASGSVTLNADDTFSYTPDAGFVGEDSFTYRAFDGALESDPVTVTVTVEAVNAAPVAGADSVTTSQDTAVAIDVLANDSDPDGDPLSVGTFTQPASGSVTLNADDTFSYTPAAGFVGEDSFTYRAFDGALESDPVTVTVTVEAVNAAPVAGADSVTTSQDTAVAIDVLANDSDPDGDPLSVGTFTQPASGSVTLNADDTFSYTPAAGFVGEDSFTYRAFDGDLESDPVTVTVTVEAVNAAPVAGADSVTTSQDTAVAIDVLANDSDPDGDPLSVGTFTQPASGSVTLNADDTFSYTPDAGFVGEDSFTYRAFDGALESDPVTVTVTVEAVNAAPVAGADSVTTSQDTAVAIDVLANDSDPDGDPLSVGTFTQPASGSVTLNADDTFSYTPAAGFVGEDSFTYRAFDGDLESDPVTVTVTVEAVNAAPVAGADSVTTSQDTAVAIDVLANDSDPDGDPLSVGTFTQPASGSVVLNADDTFSYTPDAGFVGEDSFTYRAFDGDLESDPVTVTVTVEAVNAAPVAGADSVTTSQDTAVAIDVLANDSDPDGDPLSVGTFTQPASGSVVLNADDTFSYTPAAGFVGEDSFTYRAFDGDLESDPVTVTVTVEAVNAAPVAGADSVTTSQDTAVAIDVLANDSDPDGDPLSVGTFTQPASGSVTLNADDTFSYTPAAGFVGEDSFTYRAFDGALESDPVTVTVTVEAVNAAPVAGADSVTTSQDTAVAIDVLANDSDPDGDPLSVGTFTQPASGSVTLNADDTFSYTPAAGFVGEDSFTYRAFDGDLESDPVTVTVTVEAVNAAPVAGADSVTTSQDTAVAIDVLANDSDPDGDPLSVGTFTQPASGSVTLNADDTFSYTPDAGFVGEDSFTYRAFDGALESDPVTVTVTVEAVNAAPVAGADSVTTSQDTAVAIDVLANDSDPDGDPLSVGTFTQPASGSVTLNADDTFSYTPDAGFVGEDSFTYRAFDGDLESDPVTVTVTVEAVNAAPVAGADSVTTSQDTAVAIDVLANDSDPDGDPLSVGTFTQPASGSVTLNADDTFSYTPDAGFVGEDSFTYRAFDGDLESDPVTVTVTVEAVNAAPVAGADSVTTSQDTAVAIDVLANDSDPDGDPLSVGTFTQPASGSVTLNADDTFSYTPDAGFVGEDSFTYRAFDGALESDPVTVTVTVEAVNAAPVAGADSVTTSQDTAVAIDVLANDSDPDGDPLSVGTFTQPASGSVTLNADDTFSYTPDAGFVGEDSFTYRAFDGALESDPVTVTVTVEAVNAAPVAGADSVTTSQDTAVAIDVLANDSDPDGDPLSVGTFTQPASGSVTLNADDTFSYTPDAGFVGEDSFTYRAFDGALESDPVTVTVTVEAVNAAPVAGADSVTTSQDTAVAIDVLANDSDPDGDPLSVGTFTQPASGSVTLNADDTFSYTPDAGFVGEDSFTYRAFDGDLESDPVTVTVTVEAVNAAPVAGADSVTTSQDTAVAIDVLANDSDPDGDPLSVGTFTQPASGSVTLNADDTFSYTPDAGFVGEDSFTYRAFDGDLESDPVTVTVTVEAASAERIVQFQQGQDGYAGMADTELQQAQPDTSRATATTLEVDSYDSGNVNGSSVQALLRFDNLFGSANGQIPLGATILSATLELKTTNGGDGARLHRMLQPWSDTDTWNNLGSGIQADGVEALTQADLDTGFVGVGTTHLDVATSLQAWADGQLNLGWALLPRGNNGWFFDSAEGATPPKLIVEYSDPEDDPSNNPPVASDDSATTPQGTAVQIDVLANDSDPDGDPLTLGALTAPSSGTVTVNADDTLTYTPDAGFAGSDSFTYRASDSDLESDPATVTVTVEPTSSVTVQFQQGQDGYAGVADTELQQVQPDTSRATSTTLEVDSYDSGNVNGSSVQALLRFDNLFGSANGQIPLGATILSATLELQTTNGGDGARLHRMLQPWSDTDTWNSLGSGIQADGVEALTQADLDTGFVGVGTTRLDVATSLQAWADGQLNLGWALLPRGNNGWFFDSAEGTTPPKLIVEYSAPEDGPTNTAPIAGADSVTTSQDTAVAIDVLANDSDPDGDPLSVGTFTQPASGSVTLNADDTFSYTPDAGFVGEDSFTYRAFDGALESDPVTVTVTVEAVNAAPVAGADSVTTSQDTAVAIDVLANDSDPDGDPLSVGTFTQPASGSVTLNADDTFSYTPDAGFVGEDSFTYRAFDGDLESDPVTVTVTVEAVNAAPVAGADSVTTVQDTAVAIDVLANDSDPDGDPLSVGTFTQPASGSVTLNADDTFSYTPDAGFVGEDSFTYRAFDGALESDPVTVTVTVEAVNAAPVAGADSVTTSQDTAVAIDVLANDSDPDGDPLSVGTFTQPASGSVTLNADDTFSYTPAAGFVGEDSFTYRAFDGDLESDPVTVTVTVEAVNAAPVAGADSVTTSQDTAVAIDVLANDSDPDGDPLSVGTFTQPASGSVTLNADDTFSYTPAAGFVGEDSFTYRAFDGALESDPVTVTVTVEAVNAAPVAGADSVTTSQDTAVAIDVLANDSDPDGDPLSVGTFTQPASGSVTLNADDTFSYTPDAGFVGEDSFTYRAFDGALESDPVTVTVTVEAVNAAPVAGADSVTTSQDTAVAIDVLANDSDPDGDPLSVGTFTQPASGSVTLNADDTFSYTPDAGFVGEDSFTYRAFDGALESDPVTVTVTVEAVNAAPVAGADSVTTSQDTAVAIDVLANDSDPDGDPLSVGTFTQPASGSVTLNADDTFSYTPAAGFVGEDSFTYRAFDGDLESDPVTVTVTVEAVNAAPVAGADSVTTSQDTAVAIDVLANDSDPDGDPLSVGTFTQPASGSVTLNADDTFSYTPAAGFVGEDSFTYRAFDGDLESDPVTVTVTVEAVNAAPVAGADSVTTSQDTAVAIDVLANDSDPDGDPLSVGTFTQPASGSVTLNADDTFSYTPDAGFVGEDSFTYRAFDGALESDPVTVTVTVEAVNAAPVAGADSVTTSQDTAVAIDVLANDSDPDGDPLSVGTFTQPASGSVTLNADDTFSYTPDAGFVGEDSFTYRAFDGALESDPVTVTVTVEAVNAAPVAGADSVTTSQDTAVAIDVLANDSDPDGDPLSVGTFTQPASGSVTLNADDTFSYTPAAGFVGEDSFTYRAFDGDLESDPVTVTVTVEAVNAAPVAGADSVTTSQDTAVAIDVLANDSDPDGDPLSVGTFTQPASGSVTLNADDTFSYTPDAGFVGEDSFTYRAFDGALESDPVTVTVTVEAVNAAPVAGADSVTTSQDTAVAIDVLANDSDPDGDPLSVGTFTQPASGSVTLNADDTFSYTPDAGFVGEDSFTYRAFDGALESDPVTVTVTVEAVNAAPVAGADSVTTSQDTAVAIDVLANDSDPDGDPLSVGTFTQPASGSVVLNADDTFSYTPDAGFVGEDSFTYRAFDGALESDPVTVTVTVEAVNAAPVAGADSVTTSQDTAVAIDVLANDSDPDGDPLSVGTFTQPASGSVVLNADDTFSYTPDAGFVGEDSFTYRAFDGALESDPVTVTVTVEAVNAAPVAGADSVTTSQDTAVAIDVLANDSDPDGDPLSVGTFTQPASGSVTLNADDTFSYTPAAGFVGEDSFTYRAFDGALESDPVTVTVTVEAVNAAPVAGADSVTTSQDTAVAIDVLANDSDPDGDPLSVGTFTQPASGSVTLNADDTFSYTPDAGFVGEDSFTYRAFDGDLESDPVTVTVTVEAVNAAPVAGADSVTTVQDTAVAIDVLANDSDPDGDPLSVGTFTQPASGSVTLNADDTFSYTPDAGFVGEDSFTYRAFDGALESDPVTVTVTVEAVNAAPVAGADSVTTSQDTAVAIDVLANDSDPDGDPLSVGTFTQPASGSVTLNADDTFSYTPAAGFVGEDSFTYRAFDGALESDPVTVTVTVTTPPIVRFQQGQDGYAGTADTELHQAQPDTSRATATTLEVDSYDSGNVNGSSVQTLLRFDNLFGSTNGQIPLGATILSATLELKTTNGGDGARLHRMLQPWRDTDTWNSLGSGVQADGVEALTQADLDTGFVGVGTTSLDVTTSLQAWADGQLNLGWALLPQGSNGWFFDSAEGTTPPKLIVEYSHAPAPDNNPPLASADSATIPQDTAVQIDVLANDTDPDGDALSVGSLTLPDNGSLTFNTDGTLSYTPDTGFVGEDSFTYRASDGELLSDPATVSITVEAVNTAPTASPDSATTPQDTAVQIDVLANDSDPNGDPLSVGTFTQPASGSVTLNADDTFSYTPDAGFVGEDSFTYRAFDGDLESDPVTVSVTVEAASAERIVQFQQGQDGYTGVADTELHEAQPDTSRATTTSLEVDSFDSGNVDGSNVQALLRFDNLFGSTNGQIPLGATILSATLELKTTNAGDGARFHRMLQPWRDTDTWNSLGSGIQANGVEALADADVNTGFVGIGTTSLDVTTSLQAWADGQLNLGWALLPQGSNGWYFDSAEGTTPPKLIVEYSVPDNDPTNNPPLATNDSAETIQGNQVQIDVLANDSDPDGDALSVGSLTQPANGSLSFNTDGTLTYTPDTYFYGEDSFTYRASDGELLSDPATVSITVTQSGDPPPLPLETSYIATQFNTSDKRNFEHTNATKSFYHDGDWWGVLPEETGWHVYRFDGPLPEPGTLGGWTKSSPTMLSSGRRADIAWHDETDTLYVINYGPGESKPRLFRLEYDAPTGTFQIADNIQLAGQGGRLTGAEWQKNADMALGLDQNGHPVVSLIGPSAAGGEKGLKLAYPLSSDLSTWAVSNIAPGPTTNGGSNGNDKADIVAFQQNGVDHMGLVYGDDATGVWQFAYQATPASPADYGSGWTIDTVTDAVSLDDHLAALWDGNDIIVTMKDDQNAVWALKGLPGAWEAPVVVHSASHNASRPTLAFDEDKDLLFVFYQEHTHNPLGDIFFKTSFTDELIFDAQDDGTRIVTSTNPDENMSDPQMPYHAVGAATDNTFFVFARNWEEIEIWYNDLPLAAEAPYIA